MQATSIELQAYAGHCPTCGSRMVFSPPYRNGHVESVRANCPCGKQWSMVFDLDDSGTFGVMSFQCDSGDRI